jgi:hypothetical protein
MCDDEIAKITEQIASGTIDIHEGQLLLKKLLTKSEGTVHYKVSPKGCISFYGIRNKFPITVYLDELKQILGATVADTSFCPEFEEFLDKNCEKVAEKKPK